MNFYSRRKKTNMPMVLTTRRHDEEIAITRSEDGRCNISEHALVQYFLQMAVNVSSALTFVSFNTKYDNKT